MIIIGITGASGSGKTTLANQLKEHYGNKVTILTQDKYYKDLSYIENLTERSAQNFDEPAAFDNELLLQHVYSLKNGNPIIIPEYDYVSCTRKSGDSVLNPSQILLVEGILVFSHPSLAKLFDIKVYVDASKDICLARRLKRDNNSRNFSTEHVLTKYMTTVRPAYFEYVSKQKQAADIIISNNTENKDLDLSQINAHLVKIKENNSSAKSSFWSQPKISLAAASIAIGVSSFACIYLSNNS